MKINTKQRLFEVMEKVNPDFNQNKPKLLLPIGISGSGKSSWISSNTDSNTVVVCPDDIRRELTGSVSDQSKNAEVWSITFKRLADALNAGKDVILDATNVKARDRRGLMTFLKEKVKRPFDAYAKIFDVDPEIAKKRVRGDIERGVDRSDVPDFAIDKQHQSFTSGLNSLEDEGFKIIE